MFYYIFGITDKGNFRELNEDSILIDHVVLDHGSYEACVSAPFITAVCDGVGGENAGELASRLCLGYLSAVDYNSTVDIRHRIMTIHNKIKKHGVRTEGSANMQTTLCALTVDEHGRACCVNVGDSRMYRYVNGTVRQISTDQSYGQYMYDHGRIDDISELEPQYSNAIVSSVGSTLNDPVIDMTPIVSGFGKEPDDMLIIASDGFSDTVTPEEIEIGMELDIPISKKLSALFHLALRNGSTDNISVIGIKPYMDEEELRILTQKKNVAGIVKLNNADKAQQAVEEASEKKLEKTAEIADAIEKKVSSIEPPTQVMPALNEQAVKEMTEPAAALPEEPAPEELPKEPEQEITPLSADKPVTLKVYRPERRKRDMTSELAKLALSSLDDLKKI